MLQMRSRYRKTATQRYTLKYAKIHKSKKWSKAGHGCRTSFFTKKYHWQYKYLTLPYSAHSYEIYILHQRQSDHIDLRHKYNHTDKI